MTKLLSVLAVLVVLTIGVFALPAMAQNVFDVRIIECDAPGEPDGCGSNPAGAPGQFFANRGFVRVGLSGSVTVRLNAGAAPLTTYCVFEGNWVTGNGFQVKHPGSPGCAGAIGTIKTNANGAFGPGPIDTDCTVAVGPAFEFPTGTRIGQPNFAFNPAPGGSCPGTETDYTTGFFIP